MIFNTPIFFLFFMAFLLFYGLVFLRQRPRIFLIVVSSLVFYGAWNYLFIPLLVGSAVADYFIAQAIDSTTAARSRKRWLMLSIGINLGVLGLFKYADFVLVSVTDFEALRSDQRLADDRLRRITCCDIEELHFEETLIAAFIRTVKNFQEFSDHVEVVLLPRNHDWIQRPPEAQERIRVVLERIERETGVTVRSLEDRPEITPEMFSDTTHLARYGGDVPYTSMLVEIYAPILAR